MKLKIDKLAKQKAKQALELRDSLSKSKKFGLDKNQANILGINSGVERAKQIVRSDYITNDDDIKAICRFKRWLPRKRTQKVQGSIDLWGGEKLIKKACDVSKK